MQERTTSDQLRRDLASLLAKAYLRLAQRRDNSPVSGHRKPRKGLDLRRKPRPVVSERIA